jgi:SecD/SecF fusion protein
MKLFVRSGFFDDKTNLFINVKKENIPNVSKGEEVKVKAFAKTDFFKHKKLAIGLSLLIIIVGAVTFALKGFNLSIDYRAGTNVAIATENKISNSELKADFKELGYKTSDITRGNGEIDVRIDKAFDGEEVKAVNRYFEDKYQAKVNIGVVSNIVKLELIKNAILSVLIALIGIILYVSIRFKFSYAIGGVIALAHDVLIIFALFALTRFEVSTMFIAAVLAIIGYSINDTIVSFDRIRENLDGKDYKKLSYDSFQEICNESIRQTFTRTIYTTVTTLIPVIALLVLGSRGIFTFNMAMLFGLIAGTYSSIFIATIIFMFLEKKNLGREKAKKIYSDDIEEKKIKGINC